MSYVLDMCKWSTLLGALTAYGTNIDLTEFVLDALRSSLRCTYPPKRSHRSLVFLHLQMQLVRCVKQRIGRTSDTFELVLRELALILDNTLDNLRKIKNPLCFQNIDESTAESLNVLLEMCTIPRPLPYKFVFMHRDPFKVLKISEGSYGEVYVIARHLQEVRVIKVIATYGFHHDSPHEKFRTDEVIPDAACSKYLSKLRESREFRAPNFPLLHRIHLVDGLPPECLLEAWKKFKPDPNFPAHKRPEGYSIYSLFLIMEIEYCGDTFFNKTTMTSEEALSVFLQTVSALAVAEEAFEFEHRDLHGGNLLYNFTSAEYLDYQTSDKKWKIKSNNVQAFIIDFTMSRINTGGMIISLNLSSLDYTDNGDKPDYKNHEAIYGLMAPELNQDFKKFVPRTNILWLKHLAEYMSCKLDRYYQRYEEEVPTSALMALAKLCFLRQNVLNYSSTIDFLQQEVLETKEFEDYVL